MSKRYNPLSTSKPEVGDTRPASPEVPVTFVVNGQRYFGLLADLLAVVAEVSGDDKE